jgi:hypothetical protein
MVSAGGAVSGSNEPEPSRVTAIGSFPEVGFTDNAATGGLFGRVQTAQFWPKPVPLTPPSESGARSIGRNQVAASMFATPSPVNTMPNGFLTAGVAPLSSKTGIFGAASWPLCRPLIGTSTVIVPFTPGLNVPVVEFLVIIDEPPASYSPQL